MVEKTAEDTNTETDTIAVKSTVVKESSEAGKAKVIEDRTKKTISEEVKDEECSKAKSIPTVTRSAAQTPKAED